jgi:hypothetical protein
VVLEELGVAAAFAASVAVGLESAAGLAWVEDFPSAAGLDEPSAGLSVDPDPEAAFGA